MTAGAESAYSPREWVGDAPFPWPPVLGAADGEDIVACYAVNSVVIGRTRTDSPFLKLQLSDAHGPVEARMWNDVDVVAHHLRTGTYVGVRGCMETYQGQRQLRIDEMAILAVELDDLILFLPRSARPAVQMDAELTAAIASMHDEPLRQLLESLLGPATETGHAFRLAPAAKQNHHAYLGGLLEHTLSVATVCDMLADHYGTAIDRDLLVAGALLHDIGKIREIGARGGFPYTDEGKLLGHILLGLQMVADAARRVPGLTASRLLLLQHLIASHQGRYEWQSPKEPRTLEGLILHYADDLDAKLNQAGSLMGAIEHGWTAYDRSLGRDFLKHQNPAATAPAQPGSPDTGSPAKHASHPRPVPEPGESAQPAETVSLARQDGGDAGGGAPPAPPEEMPPPNSSEPPGLETLDLFEEA
jgi:3'-5' exoribonuclease